MPAQRSGMRWTGMCHVFRMTSACRSGIATFLEHAEHLADNLPRGDQAVHGESAGLFVPHDQDGLPLS